MPDPSYYKQSLVTSMGDPNNTKSKKTFTDIDDVAFEEEMARRYGKDSYAYRQAMLAYNNYAGMKWNPNAWQAGAFNIFGDDSAFQGWQNQRLAQLNDALGRIDESAHQEDYSDPSAQAERLRNAGQNPDLTGGISPGEPGNIDNTEVAASPVNDGSSTLKDVAAIPFQLTMGVMDLYKSFQGIQALNLENVGKEIANHGVAQDFVLDTLANLFVDQNKDSKKTIDFSDVSNLIDSASKEDYSIYSAPTRKIIKRMFDKYKFDAKTNHRIPLGLDKRISELRFLNSSNKRNAADIVGNPLYSDDFNEMAHKVYEYFGDFPNLMARLKMLASISESEYNKNYYDNLDASQAAESENAQNKYNSDYFHTASGTTAGEAANSANSLAKKTNKHQEQIVDTYNEIDKKFKEAEKYLLDLSNSKKRGAFFGTLGLMLLPTLKAQVFNGISIQFPSIAASWKNVGGKKSSMFSFGN